MRAGGAKAAGLGYGGGMSEPALDAPVLALSTPDWPEEACTVGEVRLPDGRSLWDFRFGGGPAP